MHIWEKVPTFASWFFHNSLRLKVKVRAELSGDSFLLKDHESLRTLRTAEGSFLFSQTTGSLKVRLHVIHKLRAPSEVIRLGALFLCLSDAESGEVGRRGDREAMRSLQRHDVRDRERHPLQLVPL